MFTASEPIGVINSNDVYRIFELKKEKLIASFTTPRLIEAINVNIVYRMFEFIMADTQSTKHNSK